MLRSCALFACAMSATAAIAAGPVIRMARHTYHPSNVGDQWVIRFYQPRAKPQDTTYSISEVKELEDGSKLVTKWRKAVYKGGIFEIPGKPPEDYVAEGPSTRVRISIDGVYRIASYDSLENKWVDEKPVTLFVKSCLMAGEVSEYGSEDFKVTLTVGRAEKVSVVAGIYQAIPTHTVAIRKSRKEPVQRTVWWAPGIGPIKSVEDGELSMELVSFTPAKKK